MSPRPLIQPDDAAIRRLTIVIPAFNEEKTVLDVVDRVVAVPLPVEKEIVIVDDGSTDSTPKLLGGLSKQDSGIQILTARSNQGKGSAVRLGLAHTNGDHVLIQDADRELFPEEIPRLLEPILDGRADAVLGSRILEGRKGMFRYTYLCNRLLNGWANLLWGTRLTDIATGYKVFPRRLLEHVDMRADSFEWDVELVAQLHRLEMRIAEVPISYVARTRGEGKQITFWDGIVSAWTLLKMRLWPRSLRPRA